MIVSVIMTPLGFPLGAFPVVFYVYIGFITTWTATFHLKYSRPSVSVILTGIDLQTLVADKALVNISVIKIGNNEANVAIVIFPVILKQVRLLEVLCRRLLGQDAQREHHQDGCSLHPQEEIAPPTATGTPVATTMPCAAWPGASPPSQIFKVIVHNEKKIEKKSY